MEFSWTYFIIVFTLAADVALFTGMLWVSLAMNPLTPTTSTFRAAMLASVCMTAYVIGNVASLVCMVRILERK